jgi:hypothetical protein
LAKVGVKMVQEFLRNHPFLKPVHMYNLYDRFLKETDNNILILFNIYKDQYEMHSLRSWKLNGESLNVVLEEDMINGWLLNDYLANNIQKFGLEVAGDRELSNTLMESTSDKGLELLTTRALKTIETMVGREI